jgi:hypothetical protein
MQIFGGVLTRPLYPLNRHKEMVVSIRSSWGCLVASMRNPVTTQAVPGVIVRADDNSQERSIDRHRHGPWAASERQGWLALGSE